MSMRRAIAVVAGKATAGMLRILGRGGTALPGRVALSVDGNLLRELSADMDVICVTGTNGKTTTTHLIAEVARLCGRKVLSNSAGANMTAGVTAAFVRNARLSKCPAQVAVLECDEAYLAPIARAVRPKAIVITNVFRDQLDRWGEVTRTVELLRAGVEAAPEALLVLNADDSLTACLGQGRDPQLVRYFGLGQAFAEGSTEAVDASRGACEDGEATFSAGDSVATEAATSISAPTQGSVIPTPQEGIFCPTCGTPFAFSWKIYGHLGAFTCETCGYQRPEPWIEATKLVNETAEGSAALMRVARDEAQEELEVTLGLPGVFNLANAAATIGAISALGITPTEAAAALKNVATSFGRMESFLCGKTPVRMALVKNPVGMDRTLAYVAGARYTRLMFGLNDKTGDGTDISWIWDADFERFAEAARDKVQDIATFGTRATDMALRLKYAGIPEAKVGTVIEGGDKEAYLKVIEEIISSEEPVCLLLNYTAMFDLRRELGKRFRLRSME